LSEGSREATTEGLARRMLLVGKESRFPAALGMTGLFRAPR
jgi:hypothetical protein